MKSKEAIEQSQLIMWAKYSEAAHPDLKWLFHIPNGGSRNKIEAANLKKQGVKSGVPDLCLPVARYPFHGLYIEMKAGKNVPSANQKEWLEALQLNGYRCDVCWSVEEAQHVILSYLNCPTWQGE